MQTLTHLFSGGVMKEPIENFPQPCSTIYKHSDKFYLDGEFTFDLNNFYTIKEFEKLYDYEFVKVALCVLNIPENFPIKLKKNGIPCAKQREYMGGENFEGRLVDYLPLIREWDVESKEWIYLITYGGLIVKIGKTTKGLKGRFGSYATGTRRYMKTKSCSSTNFVLSESNFLAISKDIPIDIWAWECPRQKIKYIQGNQEIETTASISADCEQRMIAQYKQMSGNLPIFCGQEGTDG